MLRSARLCTYFVTILGSSTARRERVLRGGYTSGHNNHESGAHGSRALRLQKIQKLACQSGLASSRGSLRALGSPVPSQPWLVAAPVRSPKPSDLGAKTPRRALIDGSGEKKKKKKKKKNVAEKQKLKNKKKKPKKKKKKTHTDQLTLNTKK
eukprot:NODE_11971_length_1254_cov_5.102041.p3 GENE.NODE_11971_length_1254_cov_5.102041~~NODE_11971_length_1254_cov_5.102041.p3  ORF type:complete len:152 (+),score=33.85 NODE_11971_length_1254_cov_5.102041:774-1229(+)